MSDATGHLRRVAVIVPLTLLVASAGLSACAKKTPTPAGPPVGSANAAPSTAKPASGGGTVATFSGDGSAAQDTAPFTLNGTKVRVVYTVQPNDVGPVPFKWSMFAQGAAVNPASPRAANSCASCDGKQTNDLGVVPAGGYYLHVITSRPWTLTVEQSS
ncbi:MAG: hypothetical protein JWP76_2958 [Dactylosporangium sp.]|jgi:hypothetical protein|nr:hypothetical protein [Dactylosporangium sp.]